MTVDDNTSTFARHQGVVHDHTFDYVAGSPHLKHATVRDAVVRVCRETVAGHLARTGRCRVLEVGAGHGTFTKVLVDLGAQVWVTEMSADSVAVLRRDFGDEPAVRIEYDRDGTGAATGPRIDVVLFVSVLHHIPDYVAAVEATLRRLAPGGSVISFQDPLWYPRQSRLARCTDRGAYLLWRLTRGNLLMGVASTLRRVRNAYDDTNPSDTVEYHVVRKGVDERALAAVLAPHFDEVTVHRYWSTQAAWLQRLGERSSLVNTFGMTATGRRAGGQ